MLDDASRGLVTRGYASIPLPNIDLKQIAPVAWAWLHQHTGEVVYTIKLFGWFSYKIVWGDPVTTWIWTRAFGTDPGV
jgi:hypothetical protein